jgi:hypothetical protein
MTRNHAILALLTILAIVILTTTLPVSAGAELPGSPYGYAVCTAGPAARVSAVPGGLKFRITGDFLWTHNFMLSNESPGISGIENIYIELVQFRGGRTALGKSLYMRWVDAEHMCSGIYTYHVP